MHLGILASHPIQYHAPWFRALAKETDLTVFFAHRPSEQEQASGFGGSFQWDVDLLSGYKHTFLKNVARRPGVNHFFECDTPEIADIIRGPRDHETTDNKTSPVVGSPLSRGHSPFDAFIVTGWNLRSYWQAIRACRKAGVRVLVRGDSQLRTTSSPLKRAIKEITHRVALKQFDGFLSVGQRNCEYLLHYGVPEEKIFFVPHFVDNEFFRQNAEKLKLKRAEIRQQWGIAPDAFVPLFVGKFIPKKRPLDLVEAARLLLADGSSKLAVRGPASVSPISELQSPASARKLHLLFVGSGELGQELRANCNVVFDVDQSVVSSPLVSGQRSVAPSGSFTGFLNQTELPRAYVAADVLVLPSDYRETWGLVVNEAMACGLPAIVSDAAGCAPDLIDERRTGFTFHFGDVAQLAQRLLALSETRHQDSSHGLGEKMRVYSLDRAMSGTLETIKRVAMHYRA
jgi:glycosyltransferase involved in cell wall biosynthesis